MRGSPPCWIPARLSFGLSIRYFVLVDEGDNMISFEFTGERVQFHSELGTFTQAELAPRYQERVSRAKFPRGAHRQRTELSVLEIDLPEERGGTGEPDPISLALATETLAHGDVNIASAPVLVGLVAAQLAANGQRVVSKEYLPGLINGEIVSAPLQQRYRDAAGHLITNGTTGLQQRIISVSMFGKAATL